MPTETDAAVDELVEAATALNPDQRILAAWMIRQSANEARDVVEDEQEAV